MHNHAPQTAQHCCPSIWKGAGLFWTLGIPVGVPPWVDAYTNYPQNGRSELNFATKPTAVPPKCTTKLPKQPSIVVLVFGKTLNYFGPRRVAVGVPTWVGVRSKQPQNGILGYQRTRRNLCTPQAADEQAPNLAETLSPMCA
jgi:hypothetical protein